MGEGDPPSPPPSRGGQLLTPVSSAQCLAIWATFIREPGWWVVITLCNVGGALPHPPAGAQAPEASSSCSLHPCLLEEETRWGGSSWATMPCSGLAMSPCLTPDKPPIS